MRISVNRYNRKELASVLFVFIVTVLFSVLWVQAESNAFFTIENEYYSINEYVREDSHYMFLPNCLSLEDLTISSTAELVSTTAGEIENDGYAVAGDFFNGEEIVVQTLDGEEVKLVIMKSEIPAVCITLSGTDQETINTGSKDIKYEGNDVFISNEQGEIEVQTNSKNKMEIKGRGNSSWTFPKRPYQIKFDKKTSVLGMTEAKKWVLLAQDDDATLLRDNVAMWIAQEMEMKGTPYQEKVDLWIDGNYQGCYTLSQKIDSNKSSLNLSENGLLMELDNVWYEREKEEVVFESYKGNHYVLKEKNNEEEEKVLQLFTEFKDELDEFEHILYSEKQDWGEICKVIDEESFAKYYLLEEFGANYDAMATSTFLYNNEEKDELHIGPIWDNGLTLGNCVNAYANKDYVICSTKRSKKRASYYTELMKIKEFRELVSEVYEKEFKDAVGSSHSRMLNVATLIKNSSDMNYIRWPNRLGSENVNVCGTKYASTYQENIEILSNWMTARLDYFDSIFPVADITQYSAQLGQNRFEYDGNEKKPVVYVDNWLEGVDFICEYDADCINVGTHTVKVKGINRCEGSFELQYSIVAPPVPIPVENVSLSQPGASIKSPSKAKKAMTVKWKKPAKKYKKKVSGYQIQYSTDNYFSSNVGVATVKKYNTTSKKIKKLQKKTKYYVRVRTYQNTSYGPCYSYWSKTKSVTTK